MDIKELQAHQHSFINRHPWELARLKIIEHLVRKHGKGIDHILDVGCGDAFVLKQLQKNQPFARYSAVDHALTAEIKQQLTEGTNAICLYNSLPEYLDPKSDCILLLDVIEHCEDDLSVLQSTLRHTVSTDDAKIIITVPAFQQLFSEHDIILGHYRRYSMKQLQEVCHRAGLRTIETGYFFFSLLLIRGAQRLLEKKNKRNITQTINNWQGSKWLTTGIASVLWIDFLVSSLFLKIGIRIPGLSIYCICQK